MRACIIAAAPSSAAVARRGARAFRALAPIRSAAAHGAPLRRREAVSVCALRRNAESKNAAQRSETEASSAGLEITKLELALASVSMPLLLGVGEACAKEGEFGLLEGRSSALLHPAGMLFLFASTLYAGFLGWQWRTLREVSNEIAAKKKELPPAGEDGKRPASSVEGEIKELEAKRKELAAGNFKDRHNNWGSLLLAMGVLLSVEGGLNTYLRVGKLFPGPHLFAGATITVLWALAASLVPYMQKGNDTARSLHIGLNAVNVALFAWQLPTGFEIVQKVFQFTSWP